MGFFLIAILMGIGLGVVIALVWGAARVVAFIVGAMAEGWREEAAEPTPQPAWFERTIKRIDAWGR